MHEMLLKTVKKRLPTCTVTVGYALLVENKGCNYVWYGFDTKEQALEYYRDAIVCQDRRVDSVRLYKDGEFLYTIR